MRNPKFILPAMLLATALGGAGFVTLPAREAAAQAATTAPPPAATPAERPPRPMRTSHIDGRIAYLKAELKITPAQEPQFDKLAQAMRQNTRERRESFQRMRASRGAPQNAVQRLESQSRFSAMRAQELDRYLTAFRPLYDSLAPAQKQAADSMLAPHRHRGRRGHI